MKTREYFSAVVKLLRVSLLCSFPKDLCQPVNKEVTQVNLPFGVVPPSTERRYHSHVAPDPSHGGPTSSPPFGRGSKNGSLQRAGRVAVRRQETSGQP